jgi:pimeloyl-ACP methyl ester carboxylesterase
MSKPRKNNIYPLALAAITCLSISACTALPDKPEQAANSQLPDYSKWQDIHLDSLADMSIEALRQRNYGSSLEVAQLLGNADTNSDYHQQFSKDGTPPYSSYVLAYSSDGNRIYSRADIPATAPPASGYPIVIFVHGWVGIDSAPDYNFNYTANSSSATVIDKFVDAGYLVLSPALRGHGTVNEVPAQGIEFLQAWDNASYISPMFYAIDILNLMEGIDDLETLDWNNPEPPNQPTITIDKNRLHVIGHSQGADAALAVLAISGEGSSVNNPASSGSLWSGCFGPRFEQASIYGPMSTTLEAFMSGDGSWTGSAMGEDGVVNPNFIFAWPADWIGTVNTDSPEWSWQAQSWSTDSVKQALQDKFSDMYTAVNRGTADISDAVFSIAENSSGKAIVNHNAEVALAMQKIGGFAFTEFLTEPLLLHHSDQDYYSVPRWNSDLADRINRAGGKSWDFTYKGNTHSLGVSKYDWFKQGKVTPGLNTMVERDKAFIEGQDPNSIPFP